MTVVAPSLGSWTDTRLWKAIQTSQDPDSSKVISFLTLHMPDVEKVLTSAGTAPASFTLHDKDHAFRVAERMSDIVPADVLDQLSLYELTLLLMSAYLHDIGMAPDGKKVAALYDFFTFGTGDLTEKERQEAQLFVDETRGDRTDLDVGTRDSVSSKDIARVQELVMYFARRKHNDWSRDWIMTHLPAMTLGTYVDWRHDLVMVCHSHHEGFRELLEARFNPRLVGTRGQTVHFRYLAAVLRVADVVEFDPERTPPVLLQHRRIVGDSIIYWLKDQQLSVVIDPEHIRVSARPSSARIHRAIEQTLDQVDSELQVCRLLDEQTHFSAAPYSSQTLPHRWLLPLAVTRDVAPRDGTYVYIDGSFRPNTAKLLDILSGHYLYGTHMAAVRELLQNGLDAAKEAIALTRLEAGPDAGDDFASSVSALHSVHLRVEDDAEGRLWLVCQDTGVGMNRLVISDYLLVSGASRRPQLIDLTRRCREAGFNLSRTGQFGIGTLSYFMLADHVEIRTRRTQMYGDDDGNGWYFETDGIGSFGELRKEPRQKQGTEVRLRVRPDIASALEHVSFCQELHDYVRTLLMFVPCRVDVTAQFKHHSSTFSESIVAGPGWCRKPSAIAAQIAQRVPKPARATIVGCLPVVADKTGGSGTLEHVLVSNSVLRSGVSQDQTVAPQHDNTQARDTVLTLKVAEEGALPDGLGIYRISMPHFDLRGGQCVGSVYELRPQSMMATDAAQAEAWLQQGGISVAWRGLQVSTKEEIGYLESLGYAVIEIDLQNENSGRINVARDALRHSAQSEKAIVWAKARANELRLDFVANAAGSYRHLNSILGRPDRRLTRELFDTSSTQLHWVTRSESDSTGLTWRPVQFPITHVSFVDPQLRHRRLSTQQRNVTVLHPLRVADTSWNAFSSEDVWLTTAPAPDRLLWVPGALELPVCPVWSDVNPRPTDPLGKTLIELPAAWSHFYDFEIEGSPLNVNVCNKNHPVSRLLDGEAVQWFQDRSAKPIEQVLEEATARAGRAAIVLAKFTELHDNAMMLNVIAKNHPDIWRRILDLVDLSDGQVFCRVLLISGLAVLARIGPDGFTFDTQSTTAVLADPGPDWTLSTAD